MAALFLSINLSEGTASENLQPAYQNCEPKTVILITPQLLTLLP